MEKTISFKGAEKTYSVKFEIEDINGKGKEYIAFTGTCANESGQITIDPNPNSHWQKDLVWLWDTFHLKSREWFEKFTEEDIDKLLKEAKMPFGNVNFDHICEMIMGVMSHIKEEDNRRRLNENIEARVAAGEDIDYKKIALLQLLEESSDAMVDIEQDSYDEDEYTLNGETYKIYTDDEADQAHDEYLENYIDECLNIPEHMIYYFDREGWKADSGDRGQDLACYDGYEHFESTMGGDYYLYRV